MFKVKDVGGRVTENYGNFCDGVIFSVCIANNYRSFIRSILRRSRENIRQVFESKSN